MRDPTNIAIAVIRPEGLATARRLHRAFPEWDLWMPQTSSPTGNEKGYETRFKVWLQDNFRKYRGFVCFMAAGIVVRALGSLAQDKHSDPGIVVCDEFGRHAISLLGGHEGGANSLAFQVASALGAKPVVTTGTESLRPYVLGIGCRKNAGYEDLERLVSRVLEENNVAPGDIRAVATVDLKKDEPCILKLIKKHEWPLLIFTREEILASGLNVSRSAFVEETLGVPGVCEPTALMASHFGELIVHKTSEHGCAIALVRETTRRH